MSQENALLQAFNRGLISPRALGRTDLGRTGLSAEVQTNWIPRSLGAMYLRPGLGFVGATAGNAETYSLPFVFSTTDTAIIELTHTVMRVWVNDALVTRPSVATAVTNGAFNSDVTSWTDDDDVGATSSWHSSGYLQLIGSGFAAARRYQQVTVAGGDQGTVHALNIEIFRGPVTMRIGSSQGDDDYISETSLGTGTHSIAFTPTGDFWVSFESYTQYGSLVNSCDIAAAGVMSLVTPWQTASLPLIREYQSADVIFVAAEGVKQKRIERRSAESWSLIDYDTEDGPFNNENTTPITLTPDAIKGDITITASAPLFKTGHVDSLFSMTSIGQLVEAAFTAQNQFSNDIRVVGVGGGQRTFTHVLSGTWNATVTLQRSVSEPGSWVDVTNYTVNGTVNYSDDLDNQIVYYRLGIKTGDYTSGTADLSLSYANGGLTGIARVVSITSSTVVSAIVLRAMGGTDASSIWREGIWSALRGYPTCCRIYEGRMWWAGKDRIIGSITDAYHSFDRDFEGDAGPINRTVGFGPVDRIGWLASVQRLLVGTQGAELSVISSGDYEPLTPENFNIKDPSTQGSADVNAVKIDSSVLFIQRSKTRVYELNYQFEANDYLSREISIHVPEIGEPGIKRLGVQRQPDTRIHIIRDDGKCVVLLFNKAEDVICFTLVETDGDIEDVVILPGDVEDVVYYVVKRTVNAVTKRYYEKWAMESEAADVFTYLYEGVSATVIEVEHPEGTVVTVRDANGTKVENLTVTNGAITLSSATTYAHITNSICKNLDSHVYVSQASATSVTGLSNLEGEVVNIWADGRDAGTKTVAGGGINMDIAAEEVTVGRTYQAKYKSTKLAYASEMGTALNQIKKVSTLGMILRNCHHDSLGYGDSFDEAVNYQLPQTFDYGDIAPETVFKEYDQPVVEFAGEYNTDSRVCLIANAPKPVTVLTLVIGIEEHER